MDNYWEKLINEWITFFSPNSFRDFWQVDTPDELDDETMEDVAYVYASSRVAMMALAMFAGLFEYPEAETALSEVKTGLDRLWRAVLDERDTTSLNEDERIWDDLLVERLEIPRTAAEGLLAVLNSYVTGAAEPGKDANLLLQQVQQLAETDPLQALQLFGQAGAAAILGAPFWPMWQVEMDVEPAGYWIKSLWALYSFLNDTGMYPLEPLTQEKVKRANRKAEPEPEVKAVLMENLVLLDDDLTPDQQRLMDVLLCGKEKLNPKQLKSLPAFTPEVIDQLIYVLSAAQYANEDSSGNGWAPIHAAKLLGQSGSTKAVAPLITTVYRNDFETYLHGEALDALEALGPIALPMLLDTFKYSTDLEIKGSLAEALAHAGRGDEGAFRALEAFYNESSWDDERMMPMMALAEHGDPRALEIFYKALKSDSDLTPEGIREILGALQELDPQANKAELDRFGKHALLRYDSRYVRFDSTGQAFCLDCGELMERSILGEWQHVPPEFKPKRASRPSLPEPILPKLESSFAKVGRNDPCPCGSGKKFKYCHGANTPTVH